MTTPNYDDILDALDRQAYMNECSFTDDPARQQQLWEDARLLRQAADIVRERRDQGEAVRPPQEMDLG